ncbi:MAG: hypothetical protein MZW92_79475 [Comamonadaceae bacterium]|nr:hypothetical protein [Comamonadaceae bacterium]
MSKSLGNFFTIRDVLQEVRRRGGALLHPARPLPQPAQLFRRPSRRREAGADAALYRAEAVSPAERGRSTGTSRTRSASRRRWTTTSTPPRPSPVLFELANEGQTGRSDPVGCRKRSRRWPRERWSPFASATPRDLAAEGIVAASPPALRRSKREQDTPHRSVPTVRRSVRSIDDVSRTTRSS